MGRLGGGEGVFEILCNDRGVECVYKKECLGLVAREGNRREGEGLIVGDGIRIWEVRGGKKGSMR